MVMMVVTGEQLPPVVILSVSLHLLRVSLSRDTPPELSQELYNQRE